MSNVGTTEDGHRAPPSPLAIVAQNAALDIDNEVASLRRIIKDLPPAYHQFLTPTIAALMQLSLVLTHAAQDTFTGPRRVYKYTPRPPKEAAEPIECNTIEGLTDEFVDIVDSRAAGIEPNNGHGAGDGFGGSDY